MTTIITVKMVMMMEELPIPLLRIHFLPPIVKCLSSLHWLCLFLTSYLLCKSDTGDSIFQVSKDQKAKTLVCLLSYVDHDRKYYGEEGVEKENSGVLVLEHIQGEY